MIIIIIYNINDYYGSDENNYKYKNNSKLWFIL